MRYNAMDSAVTYEVHEEQEKEFDYRPGLRSFSEKYQQILNQKFTGSKNADPDGWKKA